MPENKKNTITQTALTHCYEMLVLQLLFLLFPFSLMAQNSKQELFEQSIDRFNFTTIRYVLADDKQKPEANKLATQMEEMQYNPDTLIKKIIAVYGPNSKTQILSATINSFKTKFLTDRSLSRQLGDVSKFIRDDRKGKSYLPQLEKDLQAIEGEVLEKATALTAKAQDDDTQAQVQKTSLTGMSQAAQTPESQQVQLPGWLIPVVGIIGLLSLANLYLYYRLVQRKRTTPHSKEDSPKTIYQVRDFEIYPRMEKNTEALERKIEDLRRELRALTGEKKEEPVAVQRIPEPVKQPAVHTVVVEQNEPLQKSVAPVGMVETGRVMELQINKTTVSDQPKALKKYADYPKENGFVMSQLQDSSDRRSIYEITILPDSEYAQFTIVDNKELHEYAIQNRERLLKDACDFEVSSSQHTKIEVLRPGKLQKNGNTWQIRHKAQIKFV